MLEGILKMEDKHKLNKALKQYCTNNPLHSLEELVKFNPANLVKL